MFNFIHNLRIANDNYTSLITGVRRHQHKEYNCLWDECNMTSAFLKKSLQYVFSFMDGHIKTHISSIALIPIVNKKVFID